MLSLRGAGLPRMALVDGEFKYVMEQRDGIWIPLEVTMRNLLLETHTTLEITALRANPELPATTFELRRLEAH